MGGVIAGIIILLIALLIFSAIGFFIWRRMLHFAKGVERGLKMVPLLIHLPPPSEAEGPSGRDIREVVQEHISQAEVLYNLIAGTFKKGFKNRFYGQRHLAFEIIALDGLIKFFVAVPVALQSVIEQAVLTAYPTARLEEVEDHNIFNPSGKISGTLGGEIVLKEHYGYPIATFTQLKRDAIQALINATMSLQKGDGAAVQILLRPAQIGWSKSAESLADGKRKQKKGGNSVLSAKDLLSAPFKVPEPKAKDEPAEPLSALEQSVVEAIEEKTRHPGFEVLIRIVASGNNALRAQAILGNLIAAFALFDAPVLNGLNFKPAKHIEQFVTAFIFRFFPPTEAKLILNSIELATVFHLPDDQFTHTSQVERQHAKQVEAPSKLPTEGLLFGYNQFRGLKKEIHLTDEDRRRHVYIVGQTGTGKSTILKQLIVQDMLAGKGLAFIDPHGDASEELLAMVPKSRTEDIIYFSPGEPDFPLCLNLFEYRTAEQKDFLIQEAINMLYRLYDPQHQGIIGPIYEHWFRNAALALMSDPSGATFIEIPKLFLDRQFMRDKLQHVTDPTVLDFWNKEMVQTSEARRGEILGWFVSKFGAFASNEMMRNIIGQVNSSFDLRDVMDNGKILIANLSKGRLGELNSMLLGMIFVMKFQAAAMSRADVPENSRRDFTLYVDEFQNFSTDSFATILSEARKFRLSLVVANQYISQLDESVRDAVFGNTGTIVSFRCSPNDADFLIKHFAPAFEARDLVNLPNFEAAVKVMLRGIPSQPFSMAIAPPLAAANTHLALALKQLSAAKYGTPRGEVERTIFKRLETKPAPNPFDSLGFSQSARPNSLPPPINQSAAPGGSFLDEWLAKRRSSTPKPQPPTHQYVDRATGRKGSSFRLSKELRHRPKNVTPPPGDDQLATLLASDASLNVGPGQKVMPASQAGRADLSFKKADKVEPAHPDIDLEPASKSQKLTTKKSDSAETKPPKPMRLVSRERMPDLEPGEIYIDENGVIHRPKPQPPAAPTVLDD